jgi:diaminohydroxyphosphoribosylaminopyrimidine deaminase / 5-amino-6-(5-phosphoribosylamino)uracil reductase
MLNKNLIEKMMYEAVKLSRLCDNIAYPNPKVGAVIFDDAGNIKATGFTQCYGSDHAEASAIRSLNGQAKDLNMAVTLEPCNHFGKTTPCTHAIIKSGIKRVYIAKKEENPKSYGGAEYMAQNCIEVEFLDQFSKEVESINRFFFKNIRENRCWVTAKAAITKDGFISEKKSAPLQITCKKTEVYTHSLRAGHMAICAGAGTVNADDPVLTVRAVEGKDPKPVIYSRNLSIDINSRITKSSPIIFTSLKNSEKISHLTQKGAIIEIMGNDFSITKSLQILWGKYRFNSILLEGGAELIASFLKEKMIDEFHILTSEMEIGKGYKLFDTEQEKLFENLFSEVFSTTCDTDTIKVFQRN